MKKVLIAAIGVIIAGVVVATISHQTPLAQAYSVEYNNKNYKYQDLPAIEEEMREQVGRMEAATAMEQAARYLGYSDGHIIITIAQEDYGIAKKTYNNYQSIYSKLYNHWNEKETEYPSASYIWKTLINAGYSEVVAAGILGNIMVEVGGQTFDLDTSLTTPSFYGICQWNRAYSVWGKNLEEQCNFLLATIQSEFDVFGFCYKNEFSYEDFLNLETPEEAALAFAKCYERCTKGTYGLRKNCAVKAYNYFIS